MVSVKSSYTLQRYATAEPIATSVSMFGAPFTALWKPLMKNFWLMTSTMPASRSWMSPMPTLL